MRYILDTNIVIAYLNNNRDIIEQVLAIEETNISCITLGELYFGANSSQKKEKNLHDINVFLSNSKVFNITRQTAYEYSLIKAKLRTIGKPIPDNDLWIAAIAQEHNMTIITRDKHFLVLDFINKEYW